MFFRCKRSHGIEYLQLVRCDRVRGRPRQSVLATLGRTADLVGTGAIDRMLRSAARLSKSAIAVTASNSDSATLTHRRHIGLSLVFERLWRDAGCDQAFDAVRSRHGISPDLKRIAWLQACEQQVGGRDDPARDTAPADDICRATPADVERVAELLECERSNDHGGSCRLQEEIEELIFFQQPRPSGDFTLVLLCEKAQRANRPDPFGPEWRQAVAAGVIDGDGRIVCCEAWAGDAFTGAELERMVTRVQTRFAPASIAIAADPEMIDGNTFAMLDDRDSHPRLGPRPVLAPAPRLHAPIGASPLSGRNLELSQTAADHSDRTELPAGASRVREAFGPILNRFVQQELGCTSDAGLRSQIFFASLGLRMRFEFERRLAESGQALSCQTLSCQALSCQALSCQALSWSSLIEELQQMLEFEFEHANERYVLRTPLSNRSKLVFASLGIAPLPLIEPMTAKTTP
ncbi:hypothetical protein RA307_08530 [Xanthobacteraceae bacterium Astr-EGSB]|uniref:hypothetical protein n=1 Tax=Astrobacterium formosum TaxID=3069710 RepID=UPI0027B6B43F|nr:hypothetical protein [Xanthobacteraceae bacterium Astr-EGSB]